MTLDSTEGDTVKVIMIYYIEKIMAAFDKEEKIWRTIKTNATSDDMYKVNKYCEKLNPDKAKIFYYILAETLYTTKQESPDTYKR